jgi:hypothetical protein
MNYFSTEKLVNRAYGPVDRVHGIQSMGLQHSETIPAFELAIDDRDLILWRVIFWSNPSHQIPDGWRRASGGGRQRCYPCSRWHSMGAHWRQVSSHSEAQFFMGFHPTASQRRRKIVLLTFERRLVTVAAGNWEEGSAKTWQRQGWLAVSLQWWGQLLRGQWTFVKLLGWPAWHRRQHWRDGEVGRWARVWLWVCQKPTSRVPIYRPNTFLPVQKMDSNKPPCRIHG